MLAQPGLHRETPPLSLPQPSGESGRLQDTWAKKRDDDVAAVKLEHTGHFQTHSDHEYAHHHLQHLKKPRYA